MKEKLIKLAYPMTLQFHLQNVLGLFMSKDSLVS